MNIKIVINLGACIHGNLKINYDAITKEVPFYELYRSSVFFFSSLFYTFTVFTFLVNQVIKMHLVNSHRR